MTHTVISLLPSRSARPPADALPQVVESRTCLQCDVCCRFPERESALRPFFTSEEITAAVAAGVAPERFPSGESGARIELVPDPAGEGYLCPAFDPVTSECRIYQARPLDCRLYPFAVMWDVTGTQVLLGWDTKCPSLREQPSAPIARAAEDTARVLEQDAQVDMIARHPRLIGRFQEDVIVLQALPLLTARLQRERPPAAMRVLTLEDRARFDSALAAAARPSAHPLAADSFAFHYMWRHRLTYLWTDLHDHLCLFAESPDGLFMALPPIGPGPILPALTAAFDLMRARNGESAVTRVENVSEPQAAELRAAGYRVIPKDGDYLYRVDDLADLRGDRYKSPRAGSNRCERDHHPQWESYEAADLPACLSLFREWRDQKFASGADDWSRALLDDAAGAHEALLAQVSELRLEAAVVRVRGRVRAYTVGGRLSRNTHCVLLEIADREIVGLGAFLFRETARRARADGAEWINTMDASDLPTLARSKQWYHPTQIVPNYLVRESRP